MPSETIKYQDIYADQIGEAKQFPKYSTQLMNLANQNAQGTRPRIVGQMSDLITQFSGKSFDDWVRWYLDRHPHSLDQATDLVFAMVTRFAAVIEQIDRQMVHDYLADLVLAKTYVGFKFQQGILRHLSKKYDRPYRSSTPAEESRGIDGYIGDTAISVKPHTYRAKHLPENIEVAMVYYEKTKTGIQIEYTDITPSPSS